MWPLNEEKIKVKEKFVLEGSPDVSYGVFVQCELLITHFTLLETIDTFGYGQIHHHDISVDLPP